jgi:hypothetical protein
MTVQAWIIMTPQQQSDATLLDDENQMIGGREIDNSLANNLGEGTLVGKFVVGARILNDPDYVRWVSSLGSLPIRAMDSDVLFVPSQDV